MSTNNPTPESEPSLLEQMQREFASIREELNAVKQSKSAPAEESDSELSDLTSLFDGLGKKLDEVLNHVKPKETVVGQPPAAGSAPPAAPTPKPARRAGLFW